jgi:2-oxoglutarate ferredoxin oxidoreductase subunit beta
VTFNKVNTYAWFRQNIRKLEEEAYEPTDRMRALDLVLNSEKIPVGILFQDASPPESYEERVLADLNRAPVAENLDPKAWPYERLMDEFR